MLCDLIIFQKTYDFLFWIKPTVQRFAKAHKVDFSSIVPKEASEVLLRVTGIRSTYGVLYLYLDSGGTKNLRAWEIGGSSLSNTRGETMVWPLHSTPATSLYYKWNDAPSSGAYVGGHGFRMNY